MPFPWTLITVAFNSASELERYWSRPTPADVEWIVVDNSSTDDSALVAERLGATVIRLDHNVGFSAANNVGLAAARGEFIAFVNPDVSVEFDDLPDLAQTIERNGGLVSPQLVNNDGRDQPNGRGAPLLLSKVVNRVSRQSAVHHSYLVFAEPGQERFIFWSMGAVVAGSAATFAALKGWDERFFIYYEDKDIAIRSWRSGRPVVLAGQFRWNHGWARETAHFRLSPWAHEIASLVKFYALYPEFIFGGRFAERRHPEASANSGKVPGA
ncbi:glycosyltransferase [Lacisediminihabitans changchengi]|uniref:Glycosyltransferase n=1 Tax=Lacisediminihabitans changchengi TaxID=2787634 RepID=A0A934W5U8_9MICO|nr:glycosyltransferase [Lacisediminihabitans changchengi]MBK4346442.1 glycosyltransferase [Lacisediminihabitans changchengi]MBK4348930.1 glycosyltransferase [Lacisediminihabitans changchengi]